MFCCACIRRFLCRKLLTLMLFSYLLMILLCLATIELADPTPRSEESFSLIFPEPTFLAKHEPFSFHRNYSSNRLIKQRARNISHLRANSATARPRKIRVQFQQPIPLSEPVIDVEIHKGNAGDFVPIGRESFVYSAFFDGRKEQSFVRIMTLMSKKASALYIYCHFNDTGRAGASKSEDYELCENHDKPFGGYIYSCRVPENFNVKSLNSLVISLTKYGPKIKIPVLDTTPSRHKIPLLNSYPRSSFYSQLYNKANISAQNVPFKFQKQDKFTSSSNRNKNASPSQYPLSFAICVSPLFGAISVHRLIEFIELTRLLGAEHFFFYNNGVSEKVAKALAFYEHQGLATVLPWTFPPDLELSIWYHGQLLANNDCMYRSMARFDLVAFNDVDEFIVPHSTATTWQEAFIPLLREDRCGFSFQSAFYEPGVQSSIDISLLTPILTARSQEYSKVRTKVMLCPWRVFEVGIHHISKQNREDWRPWGVEPATAYLHHYRRCIANYGMRCGHWAKDTIIADRYMDNLTINFETTLLELGFDQ